MAAKFSECHHEVRNIRLIDTTEKTTHYMKSCEICATIFKEYGFREMVKITPVIVN